MPAVIGVGLPHAGPSEVLMIVPFMVGDPAVLVPVSSTNCEVPGAKVPFLQLTASGV